MSNLSSILNLIAVLATVAAVLSSTFLTRRALRYSKSAIHVPVIIEVFNEHRSAEFVAKELFVWREMARQSPAKGFSGLPKRLRANATAVAVFYLMVSYLSEYGISDPEMLALQMRHRLLRTWQVIEPYVKQERILRGGEFTFLNTLEVFVERVREVDNEGIARRMLNKK